MTATQKPLVLVYLFVLFMQISCAPQNFLGGSSGGSSDNNSSGGIATKESFTSADIKGKVDVLFVDDNSASMETEQAALGARFATFASAIQGLDWQIGITTTDCSGGAYGVCGSLLPLSGAAGNILLPSTANFASVFNNTIQRPETPNCSNLGTCPSGNEEPLLAAMGAINKANSANAGFFRSDAQLAIVILSDEDEGSNGPGGVQSRPQDLVNQFKAQWPSGKDLRVFGFVVKPGDSACLSQQKSQAGGFGFYGNILSQAIQITGGYSGSVCDLDYSLSLQQIAGGVRSLTGSVELQHLPLVDTVSVSFNPAQSINYSVIGNRVVFATPPSAGSQISVDYKY